MQAMHPQALFERFTTLPLAEQLAFNRLVQEFLMHTFEDIAGQMQAERASWNAFSLQQLESAFAEDEPEYQVIRFRSF